MDVWFGGNLNLAQRLELLKGCGIGGIEWLKGADMAEAVQNASLFHRMGMDFASCAMGSPELTMKCASAFGKKYVWITVPCLRDIAFDTCEQVAELIRSRKWDPSPYLKNVFRPDEMPDAYRKLQKREISSVICQWRDL